MAPWVKALLYDKNDSNAPIPPRHGQTDKKPHRISNGLTCRAVIFKALFTAESSLPTVTDR